MTYNTPKKYEEIAYIINFSPRSSSKLIPGRDGPIIEAIGENRLILLETLAAKNSNFTILWFLKNSICFSNFSN